MNIQTMTPVEIDTIIAAINGRANALQPAITAARKYLTPKYRSVYGPSVIADKEATIAKLTAEQAEIMREAIPYNDEFARRGGWTRFFIVQHLHTSAHCSSFRWSTAVGWLPNYSGTTETEMIEKAGSMVCTKCVPEAPVNKRPTLEELQKAYDKDHDNTVCAGGGKYINRNLPHRTGYASGNSATCEDCGDRVAISSTGKLRKHQPKAA